jgi:hypothetical protein
MIKLFLCVGALALFVPTFVIGESLFVWGSYTMRLVPLLIIQGAIL